MTRCLDKIKWWIEAPVYIWMMWSPLFKRENNASQTERVLTLFRKHNLRTNRNKIQFAQGVMELLGVRSNGEGRSPSEIKKNVPLIHPSLRNIKEPRRFLGLTQWFGQFILKLAQPTTWMTSSLCRHNKSCNVQKTFWMNLEDSRNSNKYEAGQDYGL